jgi:hypothetical protein
VAFYVGRTTEADRRFLGAEFGGYDELLGIDAAASLAGGAGGDLRAIEQPLFVVCTHGKRDPCCAKFGRPLYEAVRDELGDDCVWQSSHVGGDRFAGNLICFPHGLYFGRVDRAEVPELVDECLAARVYLPAFRGTCVYPFVVQAAETVIRAELGVEGVYDLQLAGTERTERDESGQEEWQVAFELRGDGKRALARVAVGWGEPTYLTCSASTLRRPRRYDARLVDRLAGRSPPGRSPP